MFAISTEEIQALFDKELAKANEHNSQFHSAHEAYALLLEEVEEVSTEFGNLTFRTKNIWNLVKEDEKFLKLQLEEEKRITIELIKEALQVGAMCDKFLNYLDMEKEGKQNV